MSNPEQTTVPVREEKAELDAVLSSRIFTRSPGLAKLLSYLCGKYFDGERDQIKEYTIAVEFFKREPDFDSKESPIVRVEAGRLRAKLKEYYRIEGRNHLIQIVIASGQYAPEFQRQKARGMRTAAEEEGAETSEAIKNPVNHNGEHTVPNDYETPGGEGERSVNSNHARHNWDSRSLPRGLYVAAFSVIGLALVVTAISFYYRHSHSVTSLPVQVLPVAPSPEGVPALPEGPELRIMAGSKAARYVDSLGRIWTGDSYYTGGEMFTPSAGALQRAEDSPFCKQAREGDFEYSIPLRAGIYELHLYFAEMQYGFEPDEGGETSRIFHVFANDVSILDSVDVFSDAGGGGKVYERVFTDISPTQDGRLHLSFRSSAKGKAIVNGLEILPGIKGKMRPIRITTRASAYLSSEQQLWEADHYFRGGRNVVRLRPVEATRDPELYQSERYGNFEYAIPVAQGHYRLMLKFAETYFSTPNPLHVGPKNRLFDVYCNGQSLLKNFDIAKEAGGLNRSLDKTFHGLEPNAQGKIILSFVPVVNYACVNALEIVPE